MKKVWVQLACPGRCPCEQAGAVPNCKVGHDVLVLWLPPVVDELALRTRPRSVLQSGEVPCCELWPSSLGEVCWKYGVEREAFLGEPVEAGDLVGWEV